MTPFIPIMRKMVQEYLLGGPCKTMSMDDYIFGYKNEKLESLYNELEYQKGKEVSLQSNVNPVLTLNSSTSKSQVIGIYTGALRIDKVGMIRFNNDRNYVNKLLPIFDGNNMTNVQVSPTSSDE